MSLPEPGDLDWGNPVNDAIVAAQGDAATAKADAASAKSMGLYAKNKVDEIGTLDAERVSYALQNDEDVQGVLSATTAQRVEPFSLTYNTDGSVATETAGGLVTSYTYNADGTLNTATRGAVTVTYSYDASGNMTGAA